MEANPNLNPNPNPYVEDYIKENKLEDRAIILYYEELKQDIVGQLERIAKFLGVELNATKLEIIRHEVDIKTMSSKPGTISQILIRKGVTKDWENAAVSPEKWKEFDAIFEEKVGQRPIAQPFRPWMLPSDPKEEAAATE